MGMGISPYRRITGVSPVLSLLQFRASSTGEAPVIRHGNPTLASSRPRRGAVYLFVLTTAMLVTVLAMAVLYCAQIRGRVVAQDNDSAEAQALAQGAVEFALNALANDSNWRTDYPANLPVGPIPLGRGTIGFSVVDDSGGSLATDTSGTIRVYGIGKVNKATKVYSVHCGSSPATCLQAAVAVSGTATFGAFMTVGGSGTISSNGLMTATLDSFGTINLQCGLTLAATACTGTGARTSLFTPLLTFPDTTHAFDYYTQKGTSLSIGSLPVSGTVSQLWYRLLAPNVNSGSGGTDKKGIYIIDCQGKTISIAYCRIVGTLVLLNVGSGSIIQNSNYFSPGAQNLPVLMVQGNIQIATTATALADKSATGYASVPSINYNPAGAPYLGVSDTTYTTTYPSEIDGLVYVSGSLTTSSSPTFNGVVVVGNALSSSGKLTVNFDSTIYSNPPAGFTVGNVVPAGGTWQWEAAQ